MDNELLINQKDLIENKQRARFLNRLQFQLPFLHSRKQKTKQKMVDIDNSVKQTERK